jgi:hypothetical protein
MDFSKLSSSEKTAAVAAVVVVLAGIISNWGGLLWLSILAAAAVVVVILLPQLSSGTSLPGSRGSWLVALGAVAAIGAVIEVLRYLGFFFNNLDDYRTWFFAISVVASLVLVWVGWQEFQAEGGKFNFGTSTDRTQSGTATSASAAAAPSEPAPPPPPAAPAEPAASEPMARPMADTTDEDRTAG